MAKVNRYSANSAVFFGLGVTGAVYAALGITGNDDRWYQSVFAVISLVAGYRIWSYSRNLGDPNYDSPRRKFQNTSLTQFSMGLLMLATTILEITRGDDTWYFALAFSLVLFAGGGRWWCASRKADGQPGEAESHGLRAS